MSSSGGSAIHVELPVNPLDGSTIVTTIIDAIIQAIGTGELEPGQRLSDAKLAEQLGVSRTPVREAFQRLREIGIIEASASRFTRVALITPKQTADTLVVWLALFAALVDEVIPIAPPELYNSMFKQHELFKRGVAERDTIGMAAANVAFFHSSSVYSANPALQYSLTAAVHLVRLGGMRLTGRLDFDRIVQSQELMLEAVRTRNPEPAHRAISLLRGLSLPSK